MKEITRTERLEVAQYYLLGYTYRDMEEETGQGDALQPELQLVRARQQPNLIGTTLLQQSLFKLCEGITLQPRNVHLGDSQMFSDLGLRQIFVEFQMYDGFLSLIKTTKGIFEAYPICKLFKLRVLTCQAIHKA